MADFLFHDDFFISLEKEAAGVNFILVLNVAEIILDCQTIEHF